MSAKGCFTKIIILILVIALLFIIYSIVSRHVSIPLPFNISSIFGSSETKTDNVYEPTVTPEVKITPVPIPQMDYDRYEYYYEDQEIFKNKQKLSYTEEQAEVVSREAAPGRRVSLQIDGMLEPDVMASVLEVVNSHDTKISFFVTGAQAVELPEIVSSITTSGHEVGNYTLYAKTNIQDMDPYAMVEDFTISNGILDKMLGTSSVRMKANASVYTDEVLKAARVSGIEDVIQSTVFLTYQSFNSYEQVETYISRLSYGNIISFKLSGKLEETEYTPKVIIETPALDKKESEEVQEATMEPLSQNKRTAQVIDWLLTAIEADEFDPAHVAMREENQGALAETINNGHLLTTEPAVGYTFFGLERKAELDGILDSLDRLDGVGSFFLSAEEILTYPEQVDQIIADGQAVGIVYYPLRDEEFYSVLRKLNKAHTLLSERGVETIMVLQPWGEISDTLKEAVSTLGLELYQSNLNMAKTTNQQATTPEEALASVYTNENTMYGFKRGEVVALRMNYFTDEKLLEQLILYLNGKFNIYEIKNIDDIFHGDLIFTYPLPKEEILPEVYNKIFPGQLQGDAFTYIQGHYIGNPDVNTTKQLPGFTYQEIRKLDRIGKIEDAGSVAFFTFDDWGTDIPVTKLLDVLRKHNVKATFFARTRFVLDNPALLRAIAMEGHEVATHTHNHLPLSNSINDTWSFKELTDEEVEALKTDIQESYETLQSIIGDIKLDNGKPALSRLLRPPTLAVGRNGMEAAFDMGITYIVSGNYTSRDYKAKSTRELLRNLRLNVRGGTVVVMHFSDNAIYTADAVDQYLTMNFTNQNSWRWTFARLSDYLGE